MLLLMRQAAFQLLVVGQAEHCCWVPCMLAHNADKQDRHPNAALAPLHHTVPCNCITSPSHEEDAQRQPMRDQHQAGAVGKAARVDVADEVVGEHGDAVVHVRA